VSVNGPSIAESKSFFARWAEFYRQDWWGTTASSPAPERRGLPSPLDSPPFPNADWSYGGSPVIGEPDTNSYPLMTAINQARSRTKLYGWIDLTLNFSTSKNSNAPEANDHRADIEAGWSDVVMRDYKLSDCVFKLMIRDAAYLSCKMEVDATYKGWPHPSARD
jgi:hypothetical protein